MRDTEGVLLAAGQQARRCAPRATMPKAFSRVRPGLVRQPRTPEPYTSSHQVLSTSPGLVMRSTP